MNVLMWALTAALAALFTYGWLIRRPVSRWRHIMLATAATPLWVLVAYGGSGATVVDQGATVAVGSGAWLYAGGLLAFINVLGLVLGLVLWTDETVRSDDSNGRDAQLGER